MLSSTFSDLVWKSTPMVLLLPDTLNLLRQNRLMRELLPTHVSPMKITLNTRSGVMASGLATTPEVPKIGGLYETSVLVFKELKSALVSYDIGPVQEVKLVSSIPLK